MVKPDYTKKFQNVALRKELIARIKQFPYKKLGYRSMADFISEAIRLRLEELEKRIIVEAKKVN